MVIETKKISVLIVSLLRIIIVIVVFGIFDSWWKQSRQQAEIIQTIQKNVIVSNAQANLLPIISFDLTHKLIDPVDRFKERITKKSFGIFVTPEISPVKLDKFTGYHTGVDVEFDDVIGDVPVRAVANGMIIFREWVNGYGGVVVIRHIINNIPVIAIYGHLDLASFLPAHIVQVTAGQQIGILGDGHSEETDGVRKHLHFSLYPENSQRVDSEQLVMSSVQSSRKIDFRGYVSTEAELSNWQNPLNFY